MRSIIGGQVGTINISGGQFVANHEVDIQGFLLENIAARAIHDANNTGFELPKCYEGTREAVQSDLRKWVEDVERQHPVYWLYAPPGSGKTAIAKTLADSFSNAPKRHLLASFFFRKTLPHQNTEERFIATIAHQIKTNLPQTSRFIADAIKADAAIFQKELQIQMDKLILEPLKQACASASAAECSTWPRLLVIDGLDECSRQDAQRKILDVVSHLVRHMSFPLAVFLSSRPEAHIRAAFQREHLSKASLKICLPDTYSSYDDLRTFLLQKFQEVVKAHSHILEFPQDWPGKEVVDQVITKSSGHFSYASTAMKYIDVQDDNPMKRLDIVRGLEKSLDNENPFAELDALYRHILASVKPRHLPTVIHVLQVTLSQSDSQVAGFLSPKLPTNLSSFLALEPGELEYSLGNVEGVLVGTGELMFTPSVNLYHASFIDFLLDESRSGPYFIDISIAHAQFIVDLFRYIVRVVDGEDNPYNVSGSRSPSDDLSRIVTIAIRSILIRLPFAAITEELHEMLHFVNRSTAAQKITHICTIRWPSLFEWHEDLFSWELVAKFAAALGDLSVDDAMIIKDNFRNEAKKYVSQELQKYEQEPQCHLIPLLMVDCSISSYLNFDDSFFYFILSRFPIDDDVLKLDRISLNLEKSLWNIFCNYTIDWNFLRQIIRETGYDIKPEAYSATFLCVLKCLSDLSPLVISPSDGQEFPYLARFVSSGLKAIEHYLASREKPKERPYILRQVVALWHVFCRIGGPLLRKAGPSVELHKRLKENERIIYLFSHMDNKEDRRQAMWKSMKEAIDGYLLRNQPSSSASAQALEETSSVPLSEDREGNTHSSSSQLHIRSVSGQDPADPQSPHFRSSESLFALQPRRGGKRQRETRSGSDADDHTTESRKRIKSN